jgi:hypothetical protein
LSELDRIVNYLKPNFTVIATGTTSSGLVTVVSAITEYQAADGTWYYEKWIEDRGKVVRVAGFSNRFQLQVKGVVERMKVVEA